eukprot:6022332-Alexandrium_andersonii.AAC.1
MVLNGLVNAGVTPTWKLQDPWTLEQRRSARFGLLTCWVGHLSGARGERGRVTSAGGILRTWEGADVALRSWGHRDLLG